MLKLVVCLFYFQVVAVLYFFPWFQVTFRERAQTVRAPAKPFDDVYERWLSRVDDMVSDFVYGSRHCLGIWVETS